MPGLFSRRKNKDASKKKKLAANDGLDSKPQQPQWTDAFTRVTVEPEEVHELMRGCTEELKSRGKINNCVYTWAGSNGCARGFLN